MKTSMTGGKKVKLKGDMHGKGGGIGKKVGGKKV